MAARGLRLTLALVFLSRVFSENPPPVHDPNGKITTVRRSMRRARRRLLPEEPNGTDFEIPETWLTTMTTNPERFLLYDNHRDDRVLLFATDDGISTLTRSSIWFMDGTFKCSSVFAQLYVIRARRDDGNVVSCLYAFLPNLTKKIYVEMLMALMRHSIEKGSPVHPRSIITDFEIGAMLAAKQVFPNLKLQGCFFHLSPSTWPKIQSLALQEAYKNDPEINEQCKMINALAFLPLSEVFNEVSQMYQNCSAQLLPLLLYFDQYYVSGKNGIPAFNPEIWNVREVTLTRGDRTNNYCEGWNSSFNKLVGCSKPGFWTVLRCLQLDVTAADFLRENVPKEDVFFKPTRDHSNGLLTTAQFLQKINKFIKHKPIKHTTRFQNPNETN